MEKGVGPDLSDKGSNERVLIAEDRITENGKREYLHPSSPS